MLIKDWMSHQVVTILPNMKVGAALSLMNERKIRRLPVVDSGTLVGMVTKSDLYAFLGPLSTWADSKNEEKEVEDVMTPDPLSLSPQATIEEAALLMLERRISGIPIVEKAKIVGVITETDIFRAFVEIMGIREGGAHLALKVPTDEDLFEKIREKTAGMVLRSLITHHNPDQGEWTAVVRVRGRMKDS